MKLYTEEQVKQIVEKSRETGLTAEYLMLTTSAIELPSDDEIEEQLDTNNEKYYIFSEGAKWMREQILNQNKGETLEEWKAKFTHHCAMKPNQNK